MEYGLIGNPLGHSYSPRIHTLLADYDYTLHPLEPEGLAAFFARGDFQGFNVTIPYKQAVIPFLDALSPAAARIGAVNTVVCRPDGTLWGDNTDYTGFVRTVRGLKLAPPLGEAVVLGSGGASRAVAAGLRDLGFSDIVIISRQGEENYETLYTHRPRLLVNATPVGMYPKNGERPADLSRLPSLEAVIDLVYNPGHTALLQQAEALGLKSAGGLLMLTAQAAAACELFCGKKISDERVDAIAARLRRETENLLLIGMPGCGKTTVGRLLAEKTGRPFADTDELLAREQGMAAGEYLSRVGEAAFREREHEILARVSRESGLVIATGGGCVTREENFPLLRQNSRVIWLRRDLTALSTVGRPLSKDPEKLYAMREPLYAGAAQLTVDNNSTAASCAEAILREVGL